MKAYGHVIQPFTNSAKIMCLRSRAPQQPSGAEAAARAGLLAALALLVPPAGAAAVAGGAAVAEAGAAALPEDWGLRAFRPLAKAHAALEFERPVSRAVRALLPWVCEAMQGIAIMSFISSA